VVVLLPTAVPNSDENPGDLISPYCRHFSIRGPAGTIASRHILRRLPLSAIEDNLKKMGLSLPPPLTPAANYIPAVLSGNLVFLSGHVPRNPDGSLVVGKLGAGCSVEQGYEAARKVTLALLASLKDAIGDLDRVNGIVRLFCMVNATPDFAGHPAVANGASDLLVALLGDGGRHARVAAGMGSLPGGVPVEIEMTVELAS
jgi:enamine deaminase RidA (YjgF/YER057c/UK114 family)